jgi:hypothetical protein
MAVVPVSGLFILVHTLVFLLGTLKGDSHGR